MARFAGVADGTMPANVNSLVATTLPKLSKEITDAVFLATPFFRWLREKKHVKEWDGGDTMELVISTEKNPGARAYEAYEVLDVKPPSGYKVSIWAQAHYRVPICFARQTKAANSGKSQIVDLIAAEKQKAQDSLIDALNTDLFLETSQDPKKLNSLYHIVEEHTASAQVNVVGGISKGTYTWWRHNFKSVTSAASGIMSAVRRLHMDCSNGQDKPDFGLCDEYTYTNIEDKLQSAVRFVNPDTIDWGFENIFYKGVTIMPDKSISSDGANGDGDGTLFWLNSKYLNFYVGDANFRVVKPEWDVWQDAYVGVILADCQVVCKHMARQGVLTGAAFATAC